MLVPFFIASVAHAKPADGDRFGGWVYECEALSASKTVCAFTYTVVTEDGASRILKLSFGKLGQKDEFVLVALLPLGIYLPAGVHGKIDNGETFELVMRTCTTLGCEAMILVDPKLRWKMKAGKDLFIEFTARPGAKPITLPVSLNGISAGLDAMGE